MYNILHNKTMRISELRKLVREIIRETVIDKDGLERAGIALPQTKEIPFYSNIKLLHTLLIMATLQS